MLKKLLNSLLWFIGVLIIGAVILDFAYIRFQFNRIFTGAVVSYFSPNYSPPVPVVVPNTIVIRDLNIVAPIIFPAPNKSGNYESSLRQGVVHFPGSALPGDFGNCYIFGHSSDYIWVKGDYKTVFAQLPKIKIGDNIVVSNGLNQIFTYTVTKTFVTGPNDVSILDQQNNQKRLLTLQTSYPLGTALERFIVQAEIK